MSLPPKGRIFDDITQTTGGTPLVRLSRFAESMGVDAEILAKLEFFNPMHSVKDRIGVSMIDDLVAKGLLQPGGTVVEPTSGNTGIGLAFVCASRGYRIILTVPEGASEERLKMFSFLGAELELTSRDAGMPGAIERAEELCMSIPGAVLPQQFTNQSNPQIHRETTAVEILADTGGKLDVFVCGVGTGGTLTGVGEVLRRRVPGIQIFAVEPEDSPVLSGGEAGQHRIQGLGAGFIPDVLDTGVFDRVLTISNETSCKVARKLAVTEGIPAGISSGAALAATLELAAEPEFAGKRFVTVLPSFAERYLSTELFDAVNIQTI